MKDWYQLSCDEALQKLGVTKDGWSSEEAYRRLLESGTNELQEGKKKTVAQVFLSQFCDLLVLILISAAIISLFSGNGESSIVIFVVIILNAVLGTVQYVKAEKSLDSLKSLSAPNATVMRDGRKTVIPSKNIVSGDIIMLQAGDLIVADGKMIESYSLQVNESSLTGESTNVDKSAAGLEGEAPLADRINMVYSGSLVTYGRAIVVVTATGMNTEIGKIAALMNVAKEEKSPMQKSLDQFSRHLAFAILVICILVFALSMYRKMEILDSLMFAVALAVAAIPEALGSIVTIVQAMGTQKMTKENAIIKDLKAVESLGCVSVICSDKTGTLTQNKMTVQEIYIEEKVITAEKLDLKKRLHRYLLYDTILSNDSSIIDGKGVGDPTEFALLEMFRKVGIFEEDIRSMALRLEEFPFDSDRKLMSTKYCLHGIPHILTKGAVDVLLERCANIYSADGVRELSQKDREQILQQNHSFSENGLRVLAFAYKESDEQLTKDAEYGFTFLGLISMIDPPREESSQAVQDATRAGIRTIMITGDHKITASAIAKQIGIFHEGDISVSGAELDKMTDEELDTKIEHISVYARVSPEHKIRIVEAWQKRGNIVSMTGDGVNDAPALKKADIGVAMGITGTEVSKDAASMILADDNFATIIKAVANGRNVYRNIKNAILFLLSGNMAGILAVLYTSVMNLPLPFAPVHLLFINLLTDSLPAIAIGMESPERDLLSQKPRNPKTSILTKDFMLLILGQGTLIALSTMVSYYLGLEVNEATASTMAFATLALARLFHGFNCRSSQPIMKLGLMSNKYSIAAFSTGVFLLAFVIFVPFMHGLFSIATLGGKQIGWIILLAVIPTIVIQTVKMLVSIKNKSKE